MSRVFTWMTVVGVAVIGLLLGGCSGRNRDLFTLSVEQGDSLTVAAGQTVQMSPVVTQNGTTVAAPCLTWRVAGDIGTITDAGLFTATTSVTSDTPKTGTITATGYGLEKTIAVTVVVGSAAQLTIVPPAGVDLNNVPAGTSLTFRCDACDQYGNRGTRFLVTPEWSVTGGIGTISNTGVFRATTAGSGKVVATLEGARAECPVRVVASEPTHLSIRITSSANPNTLTVGDTMQCAAAAVDDDGNGETVSNVQWSVSGNVGAITTSGRFTATAVGTGKILARLGGLVGELPVTVSQVVRGRLAFVKQGLYSNLCLLKQDGSVQAVTTGNNSYVWPQWSPDGSTLVFANTTGPNAGICTTTASGTSAQVLAPVTGLDPAWSPNGSKVAFARGMGAGEINVISNSGAQICTIAVGVLGNPRHPAWSPDGSKIAFCCSLGTGVGDGVYLTKADGSGTPTMIYNGEAQCIAWGPGAGHITVATNDSFYLISPTGGAAQKLFDATGRLTGGFTWVGESQIIYGQLVGTTTQLFVYDVASGHKTQLTSFADFSATNPTWAP